MDPQKIILIFLDCFRVPSMRIVCAKPASAKVPWDPQKRDLQCHCQKRTTTTCEYFQFNRLTLIETSIFIWLDFYSNPLPFPSMGKKLIQKGILARTSKNCHEKLLLLFHVITYPQCLNITEKVSFIITSKASYIYNLSGQKFIKNG